MTTGIDDGDDGSGDDGSGTGPVVLPDVVRRQLVELAAAVLGELDEAEAPVALRRVRRFAPARRARAGAVPLGMALESEPAFRQRVTAAWRALHPELSEALDAGRVLPAADPHAVLAGAYLLRRTGWEEVAASAATAVADDGGERARREERAEVLHELDASRRELTRLRADLAAERTRSADLEEQVGALRRELRRHRSDADRARAAARAAEQGAAQVRAEALADRDAAREQADRAAQALAQAREREQLARRAAREGRSLADVRTRLLLDTIVDAATGLRRELALPPVGGVRPADLEAPAADAAAAPGTDDAVRPRALTGDDPAALEALVRLPQSHLVVDGYNVTKTAYAAVPLVEQRRRLVESLAPLAARTGAEVTCVFDGADVAARTTGFQRGVRVIFSEPGVTADEKIRRLVRAEPPGRVVVVVSTDAEVASGVRALGARPVPSSALVRLLARG